MVNICAATRLLLAWYCIDHKVWYEDYLRRGNLLIEEDEGVESLDELVEALQEKNQSAMCRHVISLDAVEIAPYPLRPK
ncbi:unnamed protein product [Cuscuta campestris]|uniref:Uncharacterized protein n=1 Tax=Cuscuta campestris TaxID=132261 RepID=A0A484L7J1_9ASTE|nr:unnamed protein product [Cuscuta campestris]